GILGKLDEALTSYSAFEDFDEDDLQNAVLDVTEEIRKIPLKHAAVEDVFKQVRIKKDIEALERHLSPKDIRDEFYEKLSSYARTLQTALSADAFYEEFSDAQVAFYRSELKRFQQLKTSVQNRYAEVVSYKEYEPRVRKLLDTYVDAIDVEVVTSGVNIFNKAHVEEALETYGKTPASKADYIASNMKKVVKENMEKDEAFYKKFSDLIEQTIKDFHEGRLEEKDYLEKVLKLRDDLESGYQEGIPDSIQNKPQARAFFGAVSEVLKKAHEGQISASVNKQLAKAGE